MRKRWSYEYRVTIAGINFKNPVTTASGTFGSGMEYADFVDLSALGAVTTKGWQVSHGKGIPPRELLKPMAVC
jgi:dihydroorotate dehydrogenase (NAD+) catalytic subunit